MVGSIHMTQFEIESYLMLYMLTGTVWGIVAVVMEARIDEPKWRIERVYVVNASCWPIAIPVMIWRMIRK